MKRYDEYKNLGLPWFAYDVPTHWSVLRHKNVLTEHKDFVGNRGNEYKMLSLTIHGVIVRDLSTGKGKFSKDVDKYVVVDPGDFVFCLFDVDETPRTVGLSEHRGMITGAYNIFTPHDINSTYFYYYYLSLDNAKCLKPLYTGLRKVIGRAAFMSMQFPVPPCKEQDQIVRYLDWKVSEINKLLHGYQKQIKLLEERKLSIIDDAVIHGISDTIDKKYVVKWMGEVPAHWTRMRVKNFFTESNIRSVDGHEPHLSMSQKKGLVTDDENIERRLLSESYAGGKLCEKDDLVLNRLKAHLGVFALAPQLGVVSPDYTVLRLNRTRIRPKYAEYLLKSHSCRSELRIRVRGIVEGFWRLYTDDLGSIPVCLPPLHEQDDILQFVSVVETEHKTLIEKTEKQIELLREYRTRLISDVVTGQIDVRDVIIPDYKSEADDDIAGDDADYDKMESEVSGDE